MEKELEGIKPPEIKDTNKLYLISLGVNDGSIAVNVGVKAENIIDALEKYFNRSIDSTNWESLSLDIEEIQIIE